MIEIQLTGDFAGSYTSGDNRLIIPTDTMKNVAYALAKEHALESIEDFGAVLAGHFLANHPHVETATVRIAEQPLERIRVGGLAHPHAFSGKSGESRTSVVHCCAADCASSRASTICSSSSRPLRPSVGSSAIAIRRSRIPPIGSWPRCSRPNGFMPMRAWTGTKRT